MGAGFVGEDYVESKEEQQCQRVESGDAKG